MGKNCVKVPPQKEQHTSLEQHVTGEYILTSELAKLT